MSDATNFPTEDLFGTLLQSFALTSTAGTNTNTNANTNANTNTNTNTNENGFDDSAFSFLPVAGWARGGPSTLSPSLPPGAFENLLPPSDAADFGSLDFFNIGSEFGTPGGPLEFMFPQGDDHTIPKPLLADSKPSNGNGEQKNDPDETQMCAVEELDLKETNSDNRSHTEPPSSTFRTGLTAPQETNGERETGPLEFEQMLLSNPFLSHWQSEEMKSWLESREQQHNPNFSVDAKTKHFCDDMFFASVDKCSVDGVCADTTDNGATSSQVHLPSNLFPLDVRYMCRCCGTKMTRMKKTDAPAPPVSTAMKQSPISTRKPHVDFVSDACILPLMWPVGATCTESGCNQHSHDANKPTINAQLLRGHFDLHSKQWHMLVCMHAGHPALVLLALFCNDPRVIGSGAVVSLAAFRNICYLYFCSCEFGFLPAVDSLAVQPQGGRRFVPLSACIFPHSQEEWDATVAKQTENKNGTAGGNTNSKTKPLLDSPCMVNISHHCDGSIKQATTNKTRQMGDKPLYAHPVVDHMNANLCGKKAPAFADRVQLLVRMARRINQFSFRGLAFLFHLTADVLMLCSTQRARQAIYGDALPPFPHEDPTSLSSPSAAAAPFLVFQGPSQRRRRRLDDDDNNDNKNDNGDARRGVRAGARSVKKAKIDRNENNNDTKEAKLPLVFSQDHLCVLENLLPSTVFWKMHRIMSMTQRSPRCARQVIINACSMVASTRTSDAQTRSMIDVLCSLYQFRSAVHEDPWLETPESREYAVRLWGFDPDTVNIASVTDVQIANGLLCHQACLGTAYYYLVRLKRNMPFAATEMENIANCCGGQSLMKDSLDSDDDNDSLYPLFVLLYKHLDVLVRALRWFRQEKQAASGNLLLPRACGPQFVLVPIAVSSSPTAPAVRLPSHMSLPLRMPANLVAVSMANETAQTIACSPFTLSSVSSSSSSSSLSAPLFS